MKRIVIRVGATAPEQCAWVRIEVDGTATPGRGSLAELAAAGPNGYRLLVLVPGPEVLLTRVSLPPGNRKQLLAAIPYALEESLAAEIEEQHFAVGGADGEGALAVGVISRERLEHWLRLCRDHGLEPAAIYPETLALPRTDGGVSLLLADGLALVRTGLQAGFSLEADSLDLLPAMPGFAKAGELLLYQVDDGSVVPAEIAELVGEQRTVDPLLLLAEGLVEKEAINLLQGEYSPQALWERQWRRWRLPAALLLLLLVIQAGIGLRENSRLAHYERELGVAVEEVFRRSFPATQRVVNPRVQMEQQLRALRGEGPATTERNFLRLLDLGAPALVAGNNAQLRGLRYRAGELDLELEISDLQALDRLKEQLVAQGLAVEIRTATTRGEQVQARLQLRENP
ncbi:type II secretion system protein GspL [Desulfurivibrio sp. D14AmB]|uniref:type II secretion system protein GspL n=1 Tax=Desulfurivibrio sp. D14AmB TaxID=3374370 RepID=UPI00376F0712